MSLDEATILALRKAQEHIQIARKFNDPIETAASTPGLHKLTKQIESELQLLNIKIDNYLLTQTT